MKVLYLNLNLLDVSAMAGITEKSSKKKKTT